MMSELLKLKLELTFAIGVAKCIAIDTQYSIYKDIQAPGGGGGVESNPVNMLTRYKHGRKETLVTIIRSLNEIKLFKPFVDLC